MRYILIIILPCLLFMQAGYGQVSTDRNYVHQSEIKKPGITSQAMVDVLTSPADRLQQASYFDGLGRPIQTVNIKGSQGTKDIVVPVEYDNYGREIKKFLPYVDDGTTYGSLRTTAVTSQAYYYNAANTTSDAPKDINPYSQSQLEFSPFSRSREAGAVGATWQPGDGHTVKALYLLNTAADSVRIWTVTDVANNFGTYSTTAIYAAGELSKTISVDEHGKQVAQFTDKEGKVILKKVQLTAAADNGSGSGHYGWLCTYYAYDDLNRLRLVIQPRGVEHLLTSNWSNSTLGFILGGFCFRYEYDIRNRMIRKQVPDANEVWMVYDTRDRLVMTQDRAMRLGSHQWLYTKYDNLNRPVATGLITDNTNYDNLAYHVNAASMSTDYPVLSSYTKEELTNTFYDNYTWRATYSNPLAEDYNTSYDQYFLTASNSQWPYAQSNVQSKIVTGLVTGTRVKVVGSSSTYLYTVNIYDENRRIIQVQSTNIANGEDYTTTQYSWGGQPLVIAQRLRKAGSNNPQTHVVVTTMTYDVLGRMLNVKKYIHSFFNNTDKHIYKDEQVIVQNEYDALGQLKKKKLGSTASTLETLNYDYNIRGWTLGTNRTYAKDTNSATNYFGFELAYDKNDLSINGATDNYINNFFNGNIAGMLWKSQGDGRVRRYDFSYDAANRLVGADFNQFRGATFNKGSGLDFSVTGLNYDANGNILTMNQRGWKGSASVIIDSLLYNYYTYSNRLLNVIDRANDTATKLGDFRASGLYTTNLAGAKTNSTVDYAYDLNGNLASDRNKDLGAGSDWGILYNYLQLVRYVAVKAPGGGTKGSVSYTYDALGNKLKKVIQESGKPDKTTLYLAGAVYENDTLQFLPQEEGRLRYTKRYFLNGDSANQLVYDYFLKDHLGNVRMVLTEQQDTTQYFATMEAAYRAKENKLFYNIPLTSYSKALVPGGYPTDATTTPNDSLVRVNGSGNKVGPALVLKVMSGDKVDLAVKSFYKSGGTAGNYNSPVTDILGSLAAGIVGTVGESKGALSVLNNNTTSPLLGALNSFRSGNNPDQASKPKAYLNWILLDEQFGYVAASSGALPVGGADALNPLANSGIPITKNGFLYIYVSNETQNWDVFFDNLAVKHYTGPITEETHYYPFGLTMAGISSKASKPSYTENDKKYNGIEYEGEIGIDIYDAQLRELDPQMGRWWQIDPKTESMEMWSPYVSNYDNPIRYSDPLGDAPQCCGLDMLINGTIAVAAAANSWGSNQIGGAGRKDVDEMTLTDTQKSYAKIGQRIGDVLSIVTGAAEAVIAGAGEIVSFGTASPAAIPLAIHGASSAGFGFSNLIKGFNEEGSTNTSSSNKGGAEPNAKGKAFEEANGITSRANKETYVGPITGKDRKVDNSDPKVIMETKANDSYIQHLSSQIKDGIQHALNTGREYLLKLSRPTKITKPLKKAAEKSNGQFRIE